MKQTSTAPTKHQERSTDLTLLGQSSQDMGDKVYTLAFGVDLTDASFDGLHNYAVAITCLNRKTGKAETLNAALEIHLGEGVYRLGMEGSPPRLFSIRNDTLDLNNSDLDPGIIDVVNQGISWLVPAPGIPKRQPNRRHIPSGLLHDTMAINLLMSSVSTLIAGAQDCQTRVISQKSHLFTSRDDFIGSMFDCLKEQMDHFTCVAINRCVNHTMATR